MPIQPYDEDPRSEVERQADEEIRDLHEPPAAPNRLLEVLGIVALGLSAAGAGLLLERIKPQSKWTGIAMVTVIVTVFVVLGFLILQVVTRRRRR